MRKISSLGHRFSAEESGATMVEYALLAGLIGVAAIAVITAMRDRVNSTFDGVTNALPEPAPTREPSTLRTRI